MDSAQQRFWSKVEKTDSCWLWTGCKNRKGYGWFAERSYKQVLAHRFSYRTMIGEIPVGAELDHLCKVRHCVNPAHLDPVDHRTNVLRGDHPSMVLYRSGLCRNDHAMTPENVYTFVRHDGRVMRQCRECERTRGRKRQAAKRDNASHSTLQLRP